jgi:hypothetical protein
MRRGRYQAEYMADHGPERSRGNIGYVLHVLFVVGMLKNKVY